MNKIIITGASGFIGSNILRFYIEKNFKVLNLDYKEPKNKNHIKYWKNVDITNQEDLQKVILDFNPEYVIHLAARTDLNGKNLNDYNTNTVGTQNLIEILNQTPSVKRVIFTSSMLVCNPGYIPKHPTDYAPSTIYGESKVLMEKIIWEYKHNYEWVIGRPTSIWGPGFGEPYRNFFDMVINNKYFHIGDKSCTKTYGYVENLIYQIDSMINAPVAKIQGNVFYLGDYEPINIHSWANEIASEIEITIKTVPYQLIKLAAFGGDILKLLGIKFPMTSFRLKNMTTNNVVNLSNTKEIAPNLPYSRIEGVRATLNWLKNNK
jgi:nucleoside-diphosphate-sugar epimerase